MPGVLKQEKDDLLTEFIEKCKLNYESHEGDITVIWETELKREAKRIFTLLSIKESVFKELQGLSKTFQLQQRINRVRSKKILNGSGSIGSISSRIRSISLNGSQTDLNEKQKVRTPFL